MAIADMVVAAGFAKTKSEARRLVQQGAIRINDEVITDPTARIAVVKNEDGTFTMWKIEESR